MPKIKMTSKSELTSLVEEAQQRLKGEDFIVWLEKQNFKKRDYPFIFSLLEADYILYFDHFETYLPETKIENDIIKFLKEGNQEIINFFIEKEIVSKEKIFEKRIIYDPVFREKFLIFRDGFWYEDFKLEDQDIEIYRYVLNLKINDFNDCLGCYEQAKLAGLIFNEKERKDILKGIEGARKSLERWESL